ncbi:hypothetical protein P691DRAFT_780780 [Macrolepiota fuliginosa MF-IS2]|uniref:Uncharacterized protein n=1 Tax=Macrolepiota fuliginosa MF-IS2 TaxID=1400762 RepID=A0A9P5X170_9AGAR|nr:hypothetical protein P691DRAFT_780780 [Macrolepiota fuliginosa MF-IS2]
MQILPWYLVRSRPPRNIIDEIKALRESQVHFTRKGFGGFLIHGTGIITSIFQTSPLPRRRAGARIDIITLPFEPPAHIPPWWKWLALTCGWLGTIFVAGVQFPGRLTLVQSPIGNCLVLSLLEAEHHAPTDPDQTPVQQPPTINYTKAFN